MSRPPPTSPPPPVARDRPFVGPRERLAELGTRPLTDAALVAILLGTGTREAPVESLARAVLAEHGGLERLAWLDVEALQRTRGVGATKAARIAAAFELGRRSAHAKPPREAIRTAEDVHQLLSAKLAHLEVEHFLALTLDARHRVTKELWIHKGTMTSCPVSIADVFRAVLREASPAVVFVHNHPSGDPEPSRDDVELTNRLVEAAHLLGVSVLDHVVIAREGYRSLREEGLMPKLAPPSR